jgi:hypothetical protein
LHPIVVTADYELIAGQRRIEAFRQLGRCEIPVTIIDLDDPLAAELDENAVRKGFTRSEAVAIGDAIKERERERARERMVAGHNQYTEPCDEKTQGDTGKVRDIVAARVGMSGSTYEKAKAVVNAATAEPERFGPIKDEMDRTGKVTPAYEKVRALRTASPGPTDKTRAGVAARRERIIQMGNERFQPEAIADAVGVTEQVVRQVLRDAEVETVSDRIGRLRRADVNRTMTGIVEQATPPENALALVEADWNNLDTARFAEWADGLSRAVSAYSRLIRRLRKDSSE